MNATLAGFEAPRGAVVITDRLLDRVILRFFGLTGTFGERAELPAQPSRSQSSWRTQSLEENEAG